MKIFIVWLLFMICIFAYVNTLNPVLILPGVILGIILGLYRRNLK